MYFLISLIFLTISVILSFVWEALPPFATIFSYSVFWCSPTSNNTLFASSVCRSALRYSSACMAWILSLILMRPRPPLSLLVDTFSNISLPLYLQRYLSISHINGSHSRSYYRGRRGHRLIWFSQNHGIFPQKEPTGVILVSFDHFASSDFNVWLRSWVFYVYQPGT